MLRNVKERSVDLIVVEVKGGMNVPMIGKALNFGGSVVGIGATWESFPSLFFQGENDAYKMYGPAPNKYKTNECALSVDELMGVHEANGSTIVDLR